MMCAPSCLSCTVRLRAAASPVTHRCAEASGLNDKSVTEYNVLRKSKAYHFSVLAAMPSPAHSLLICRDQGHDGLKSNFWKLTAATKREILQCARDGTIVLARGPAPADATPPTPSPDVTDQLLESDAASPGQKRAAAADWAPEAKRRHAADDVERVHTPLSRLAANIHAALAEFEQEAAHEDRTALVERERDEALAHAVEMEKQRDDALKERDAALRIAEESDRELRLLLDLRAKRVHELKSPLQGDG